MMPLIPPRAQLSLPPAGETRVQLAQRLFREFYPCCFWHYRPDLAITEDHIPLVVEGLRRHGGRRGLLAAARLTSPEEPAGACR